MNVEAQMVRPLNNATYCYILLNRYITYIDLTLLVSSLTLIVWRQVRPSIYSRRTPTPTSTSKPTHTLTLTQTPTGEREYLFAPYSVFTLVSVEWSSQVRAHPIPDPIRDPIPDSYP